MKAVLFFCLLAFMTCEKDIIDIGKCIYKAPKVKELIADVMIAFATKDFSKLLPKIKEALPELIHIVIGCITEEKKVVEEEPELKFDRELYCVNQCHNKYGQSYNQMVMDCIKDCLKIFQSS